MEPSPKRLKMEAGTTDSTEETGTMAETISSDGDVTLVVGSKKTRFRVSSVQLAQTSTTFKAMFFGGFAESLPSTSTMREVPLPDDRPNEMRILLNIAHHRNHLVKNSIENAFDILDLAQLVDKYDMTTAVKFSSFTWLQSHKPKSFTEVVVLILSAYHFKNHRKFYDFTSLLIRNYSWTVDTFYKEYDEFSEMETLPSNRGLRLVVAMEGCRNYVLERIEDYMVEFSQSICNVPCESKGVVLARIKSCLQLRDNKNDILGLKTEPLKVIIEKLRSFDVEGATATVPGPMGHVHLSPLSARLGFSQFVDMIDGYSHSAVRLACILDGKCYPMDCDEHDIDSMESSDR